MHIHVRRRRVINLASLAVALIAPAVTDAQAITGSAVSLHAQHELLGGALVGGGVHVTFSRDKNPLAFRLGAQLLGASARRVGSPCAGLIQPGTCAPEPLRDQARLFAVSGGIVLRVLTRDHVNVETAGDLVLAGASVDTEGLTSGRALSATKQLWGPQLGLAAQWTPSLTVPVALNVGAAVGSLNPFGHDWVVDGYTPFESGFRFRLVQLGVTWRVVRP